MFAMMGADIPALTVEKDLCVTDFKPQCITWCDFLKIFYYCSNYFKIKQYLSCHLLKYITFNRQVDQSHDNELSSYLTQEEAQKCLAFNLNDKVICKWKNELSEGADCEIEPCSLMKLTKVLLKIQTLDNFEKLCKLKLEALTRAELVSSILRSICDKNDKLILTISVKLSPNQGNLSPMLFNFKYEISDLWDYSSDGLLDYALLMCPKDCSCCPSTVICKEDCPCIPPPKPEPECCIPEAEGDCFNEPECEEECTPEPEPETETETTTTTLLGSGSGSGTECDDNWTYKGVFCRGEIGAESDNTWYWGYSQAITTDTINPNYLNNPIIAVSDKGYTPNDEEHEEGYVYVYAMDNNGNLNILGRENTNGKVTPNHKQSSNTNQHFGYCIDIACMSDGYYLFVSSPYYTHDDKDTGRVDVYYLSYDTTTDVYGEEWEWKSHTKSNDKNDGYGESISVAVISDTEIRIAIGCPRNSDYVRTYDYQTSSNEWNNKINLTPDQSGIRFGDSVSLNAKDGTILAVGAPEQDENAGAVYIYTYDGPYGWVDHGSKSYSTANSYIGKSVSLNYAGDYLAVGSEPSSGSIIYLYHYSSSGDWTLVEEKSSTTNTRSKVKLSRDENSQLLVVGTPDMPSSSGESDYKGLITIYKYTSTELSDVYAYTAGKPGDYFGTEVAINQYMATSSWNIEDAPSEDNGYSRVGAVYYFTNDCFEGTEPEPES